MDRRAAIKKTSIILGLAIGSPVVMSILNGCVPEKSIDWKPRFFTLDQSLLIADISDVILPRTNTPGALDVDVDAFIDFIVHDCYFGEEQQHFVEGLAKLDKESNLIGGDIFIHLSHKKKTELLTVLETKADSQSFYTKLKGLILLGYFTSEEIMTKYLEYVPVPSKLEGCIPLKSNQKIIVGNHL